MKNKKIFAVLGIFLVCITIVICGITINRNKHTDVDSETSYSSKEWNENEESNKNTTQADDNNHSLPKITVQ